MLRIRASARKRDQGGEGSADCSCRGVENKSGMPKGIPPMNVFGKGVRGKNLSSERFSPGFFPKTTNIFPE
jgi:hypothetical protein